MPSLEERLKVPTQTADCLDLVWAMNSVDGAWEGRPLVRVENLSFRFDGCRQETLSDIDLSVEEGEFVLITGPSGCGKTTLARCVNGLIPHLIPGELCGRVLVAGHDTAAHSVASLALTVGMVFQVPEAQLFNLVVEDEVAFGCRNLGLPPQEVAHRVDFALQAVGIDHLHKRAVYGLSGGEKQLVAIASVLAMRPKVIVLDEPLSSLDARGVRRVLEVLTWLNRAIGMTVLLIEHRVHRLADVVSRVVVLDEGKIVLDGSSDILHQERSYLSSLGVRLPGALGEGGCSSEEKVSTGESTLLSTSDTVISIEGVSFAYSGHHVLRNVSLQVRRGEFVAIVGDSGAGKTTLAHLIAGSLKPSSGALEVVGKGQLGQKIGLLLQNPSEQLFCDTVEEEVCFGPQNFGLSTFPLVNDLLSHTDLLALKGRQVQNLSRGQQQRLALAAVLALEPKILILDEPTLGQDWGHLTRFMLFVKALQRKGTTVLLITHDLDVAQRYADRIVSLCGGKITSYVERRR